MLDTKFLILNKHHKMSAIDNTKSTTAIKMIIKLLLFHQQAKLKTKEGMRRFKIIDLSIIRVSTSSKRLSNLITSFKAV